MSNLNRTKFQTFVILDVETTGLTFDQPKITELAMIVVSASALDALGPDEQFPRVLNKFVKFFNPMKTIHSKATEISQLNNVILQNQPTFNRQTVKSIEDFLSDFARPICFVAHNGNVFDFPIFFNEIRSAISSDETSELFSFECVDSIRFFRPIFRLLIEPVVETEKKTVVETQRRGFVEIPMKFSLVDQIPSLKLEQIYEREFKSKISTLKSHRAEDDCLMLLAILKLYLPDWFDWIDENSRLLSDFNSLPSVSSAPPTKKVKRPLKF